VELKETPEMWQLRNWHKGGCGWQQPLLS
jgi:hypothetical protein